MTTDDNNDHDFVETAMGLGKAATKVTLTPLMGLGLLGVATTDAMAAGTMGSLRKAEEVVTNIGHGKSITSVNTEEETPKKKEAGEVAEATKIDVFFIEEADWKLLRSDYVEKGIPFILRHKDGSVISTAEPPSKPAEDGPTGNINVVADHLKVKLPGIDEYIKKLLPHTYRAYWPLWFQGNYKSGLAHVDLGPGTINFYYMKRGKKDVVIADYGVTRHLKLKTGIDNIHIPDSSGNHDYLKDLDRYYRVELEEQSILVFNNSGCLHHFTNVIQEGVSPIALSVRCKHAVGSSPRGWLHLAGDLKVWWNMTDHLVELVSSKGGDSRKQDKA